MSPKHPVYVRSLVTVKLHKKRDNSLEISVSEKVQVSFGQRVGPQLEPETSVPEKAYTTDV